MSNSSSVPRSDGHATGTNADRHSTQMTMTTDSALDARRRRTVVWVMALATVGLIFDGYDLVVYGAVVSTFLRDASQIGTVTPATAGALGSYALVGVLVGALLAGSVGDILGRRKVMLFSYAWFSVVAACFLIGSISIALLTLKVPLGVLLAVVAIVGLGTSG